MLQHTRSSAENRSSDKLPLVIRAKVERLYDALARVAPLRIAQLAVSEGIIDMSDSINVIMAGDLYMSLCQHFDDLCMMDVFWDRLRALEPSIGADNPFRNCRTVYGTQNPFMVRNSGGGLH